MIPTNEESGLFHLGIAPGFVAGAITVAVIAGLCVWLGVSPL